ncbi:hypothetical protein CYMTET_34864, partial [Cymbomonas tetramitiformis]
MFDSHARLVDSVVDWNSARTAGGGIYSSSSANLTFEGGVVKRNRASDGAGLSTNNMTMHDARVLYNVAVGGSGGGLKVSSGSSVQLGPRVEVSGNRAKQFGGGVKVDASIDIFRADLVMTGGVEVRGNVAERFNGGGVFVDSNTRCLFYNVSVTGNQATEGGGISIYEAVVNAAYMDISGNHAGHQAGGMALREGSLVWLTQSRLAANAADSTSAGILLTDSTLLLGDHAEAVGGALGALLGERQEFSTGGAVNPQLDACLCAGWSVCVEDNTAANSILLVASISTLHASRVLLQGNIAAAALSIHGSSASVTDSKAVHNYCSVLQAAGAAHVSLAHSELSWNVATYGPAVTGLDDTNVSVVQCRMRGNQATYGGAVYLAGAFAISDTAFAGNAAVDGAAAYLSVRGRQGSMAGAWFEGNQAAGDGAALLVNATSADAANDTMGDPPSEVASLLQLEALQFFNNTAAGGASILFWVPARTVPVPEPECKGCIAAGNTAGYSTAEGRASLGESLHASTSHLGVRGGFPLDPPLMVSLKDMYNLTDVTGGSTMVVELSSAADAACRISGTRKISLARGEGRFDQLELHGPPGSNCPLRVFTSVKMSAGMERIHADVPLTLRYCVVGERFSSDKCYPCQRGEISFRNDTDCQDCAQYSDEGDNEKVACPGNSTYTISTGAFLPPGARLCGDDAACLLRTISTCEIKKACSIDDQDLLERTGYGTADVDALRLCNYAKWGGVRGTTPPQCSDDHFTTNTLDGCQVCPSKLYLSGMLAFFIIAATLAFAAIFVIFRLISVNEQVHTADLSNKVMEEAVLKGTLLNKARNALTLLLGYMQVMSQIAAIYEDLVPKYLDTFVGTLSLMNLNIGRIVNLKCLQYHFSASSTTKEVYIIEFIQNAALPWVLCAVCTGVYYMLLFGKRQSMKQKLLFALQPGLTRRRSNLRRKSSIPQADSSAQRAVRGLALSRMQSVLGYSLQAANMDPEEEMKEWKKDMRASCVAVTLFLLMFIHPGVSVQLFKIFDCRKYYYNDTVKHRHLQQAPAIECSTKEWKLLAGLAGFSILIFSFGYPLAVCLVMRNMRCFCKVCVTAARRIVGRMGGGSASL